jgi:beta-lysine 5,6-aminomutase beta subunit
MLKVNKKRIRPYGDRLDDGAIQLSFTFPVNASLEAREVAKHYLEKLGLKDVRICTMESMGKGFCFFVAYGFARHTVDITKIKVPKVEIPKMDFSTLKDFMTRHLERPLVVIGATTGSDAHTVGIDAIMNMKGFAHDYGLERYPLFKAYNLRSQLTNRQLLDKAVELKADAILISQVVTQRDSHIKNLKELRNLWKKDGRIKKEVIVIVGGPRIDHALALKLGFDAGFGPGTKPSQVANFVVREYMKRHGIKEKEIAKFYKEDVIQGPIAIQETHEPGKEDELVAPADNQLHRTRSAHPAHGAPKQGKPTRKKARRGKRGGRRRWKTKKVSHKAG